MTRFSVEISRDERWGPFAYSLYIKPAPRYGTRLKFAWTRSRAEAEARRWIRRAEAMGPKQAVDTHVITTVGEEQ